MLYNLFENRDFVSVFAVALLAEGVDRNKNSSRPAGYLVVALLAEGVDRNISVKPEDFQLNVALLAEGVDRNHPPCGLFCLVWPSPSSRRAWIEIFCPLVAGHLLAVALLAEGVDRNSYNAEFKDIPNVALLAEGVDRN